MSFPSSHLMLNLAPLSLPVADAVISPVVILILCVAAGVGTVLLLPSAREAPMRKIGAALLIASGLILAALLVRFAANTGGGGMGVYFWVFATIALAGAVRVVTHPRPVYSALYFVLTVFATAGLFVLLWAEFMAAALVLIYAGAILVTYVFVIMLAADATPTSGPLAGMAEYDVRSRDPLIAAAVGFGLMGVLLFVIFDKADGLGASRSVISQAPVMTGIGTKESIAPDFSVVSDLEPIRGTTQELGRYLFENQLLNLELAGLLLTIAMVGAIVIARRRVVVTGVDQMEPAGEVISTPSTPIDDNPHSIPVYGTENPRQKAFPET